MVYYSLYSSSDIFEMHCLPTLCPMTERNPIWSIRITQKVQRGLFKPENACFFVFEMLCYLAHKEAVLLFGKREI